MRQKDKRVDIDVHINPDGKVSFKIEGIKGKGCLKYADAIKKALGSEGTTEPTHEFWESEVLISAEAERKIDAKIKTSE
ncbi:MAG: DUF2997 domain-containing protein [Candidatus Coatesbacteria bacterium]|nr:DUF2997 domain-containing protein [Candidatus Coatesbacteria bacterium]